ncbi:GNAT family N-acetyltransferase [Piscinibacter sp. XHJ-5]|uniref:GNAT family N-acetyltransferase n=1 Tax=Piscinibacter sp. XHJ-5 TaxID=3037797 RepID=UPI0024532D50|nr:GNAT family N-acetyltransferase [Piscinibacter sp. XHJ-5]
MNTHIRPIEAKDLGLEVEFVESLSAATGYQRLMSARRPTMEELRRWTNIDHAREVALIATALVDGRECQLGVARYVRDADTQDAEFAIVLRDDSQGRGLGRELLLRLLDAAKRAGLHRLVGTTLSDNQAMVTLARRLGFRASRTPGGAFMTTLTLDLAAWQPQ